MSADASPEFQEAVEEFRRGNFARAREIAEAATGSDRSAQWQHLLGLIHCRLGDPGRGVPHLRAAADVDESNLAFRTMLIRALVDSGHADQVLEMPEPPPIRSSEGVALWQARGEAADMAGDFRAAASAWSAIAAAVPGDWRAWANLGNALAAGDRWDEAGQALLRAAALNPGDPSLRSNAGSALAHSDRLDEAAAQYRKARELAPDDADTVITLSTILARLNRHQESLAELNRLKDSVGERAEIELAIGRSELALMHFTQAQESFSRALALSPSNEEALYELGSLYERTNQLDRLAQLLGDAGFAGATDGKLAFLEATLKHREGRLDEARELLPAAEEKADPVRWHRLRSKIADSADRPAESFEAAASMNRAANDFDEWRRKAKTYRQDLRKTAQAITPGWGGDIRSLPPSQDRPPAFLVGFPRSGTTLLETFLMGHPSVAVLEEEQALVNAARIAGPIADLPGASADRLERARNAYLAEVAALVPPQFDGLVVDKQPLNMLLAPLIHALFPGAPIVVSERHPCDAVLSGFMQSFIASQPMANFLDIADAADFYDAAMSVWDASSRALPLNVATVKYEELVADPESALRPALSFLGLPWDDRILDHQSTAKARGAIKTASYDQVTEPISTRPAGRWKRYREQLEPVLPVLLPWAERLGYSD